MRILNIVFKNINSLAGEGRVSFDQGALADSGVFAITGPNGSGKTSILDVITLGLYGETYRFNKPAEHIITKHSNDSLAQVEFAFNGEVYRSVWQVNRADIDSPRMTLTKLSADPTVLAETPNQVRQQIQTLTGLDFHRFCKSIVLPQGDFALFLNALDSERMDILEKISGGNIYSDYQQQVESRHSKLAEAVAALEYEAELIPLLSPAALEASVQDLQDFQELSAELKAELQQLQNQQQNLQEISALQTRQLQLDGERLKLQQGIEALQQDLQRIATAPDPAMFKEYLQLLDKMQAEAALSRANLQALRGELSQLQQQLQADAGPAAEQSFEQQKQLIDNLKLKLSEIKLELPREKDIAQAIHYQLQEKNAMLGEVESWLQEHQLEAMLVNDFPEVVALRNFRNELAELEGLQKTQGGWAKKTTATIKRNKSDIQATQNRIAELTESIAANEATLLAISQGKNFNELKELYAEQQLRVKDFQALLEIVTVTARLGEKKSGFGSWFGGNKTEVLLDAEQLQTQVDALQLEMSREENIGKALEQAISNESMLKKLNAYRDKLVNGKPCYLCGSLQHPYLLRPPVQTDSKKALSDQRAKLLVLRSSLESAKKQLSAAQKQDANQTAKQKFLQEKRNEWVVLTNRLLIAGPDLDIYAVGRHKELLTEEQAELDKIKGLVEEHAQLQRSNIKSRDEIGVKQAELSNLQAIGEKLAAEWAERGPEVTDLEQRYTACQANEKAVLARLEPQLSKLGEKLPGKGKEDAVYDRLNSCRQDYQIRELRQKGLREEISDLQVKLQACQTAIGHYQEQQSTALEALRREEAIGLHLAVLEKQKLLQVQEQQLRDQEEALVNMQLVIADKVAEHGFADLQALYALLALVSRETELRQTLAEQNAKLMRVDAELAQLAGRLQQCLNAADVTISAEDLRAMQKLMTEKIDIAGQEIRALQTILNKQEQYRKKFALVQAELDGQQALLSEAARLRDDLFAEPGSLRRKTQQLLIDKLMAQANQVLEKINGRYYIRGGLSEHGLALSIEDSKQKNARRLPKTLSGGESFIVSLALALALADIANNGKAIESLFLDEGFGNLDAESLYLAINTLESLKLQGKTVGVISHVEGVKKRIKTQIELVKNANGLSELKLVA